MFVGLLSLCTTGNFDRSLASNSKGPIKCLSLKINHVKLTLFYPFTVSVNKCGGSCKTVDDSYAQFWIPNKVSMNVKILNLMPWVNEIKCLVKNALCECKY